jgi:hypothetical protein
MSVLSDIFVGYVPRMPFTLFRAYDLTKG